MADPPPLSYLHIIHRNRCHLETLIDEGKFKPLFLWHLLFLTALPLGALVVARRHGARYVRRLVFGLVGSMAFDILRHRRALLGANGYMTGLITTWLTIWAATLLIFHDPELEFQRIERAPSTTGDRPLDQSPARAGSQPSTKLAPSTEPFIWQPYPKSFRHRVNWSLGLLMNMRGPEWNWRISSVAPLPPSLVQDAAAKKSRQPATSTSSRPDARAQLRAAARTCLRTYLAIDALKVAMMHDPYFWGVVECAEPFPFSRLPSAIASSATYIYRFLLTGAGVFLALTYVSAFNPLIFMGLSVAFPRAARTLTATPLDAPWLYTDIFGPFWTPLLDHGLAGCWSQWWHQLFRFGFTSTAHWLLQALPHRYASHRNAKRIVMTFVAFGLSGLVHAAGSYTQLAQTRPLSGTLFFFVLQAVGISVQESVAELVLPALVPRGFAWPRWVRRAANVLFVTAWLLASASYVMDDFARGGLWLTEPLPVSPLRGLGFGLGVEGEGWWCWSGPWFRSWGGRNRSFGESGIRVM